MSENNFNTSRQEQEKELYSDNVTGSIQKVMCRGSWEIGRYAVNADLAETVLSYLIKQILIDELKKVDGVKAQEVWIVYNFVRNCKSKYI